MPIRSRGAEEKAAEEGPVARYDPVPKLYGPEEWAPSGKMDQARVPADFFQDEENRPPGRELTTAGSHDLHRIAGLLTQRGGHGRAGTLLEAHDLESLLAVMPPDPGGSSPSEVSPTIPNEQVASHQRPARRPGTTERPVVATGVSPETSRSRMVTQRL